jgi:Ca2+/H+ antiporter, TMEM165/GDT1 family
MSDWVETFLISTGLVAIAEMGDKTQLLAILLAARFGRPVPILWGVLAATLLNHGLAAALGAVLADQVEGRWFQILMGAGFLAMALWALVPDRADEGGHFNASRRSVFVTTFIAFFLVEIGDKTQVATTMLGARFENIALVALGTTFGMMLANVPAVVLGERLMKHLPVSHLRIGAAVIFALLGGWVLWEALRPAASSG